MVGFDVRFIGHMFRYNKDTKYIGHADKEDADMKKGYFVAGGYMGYVDGSYMLFAGEEEYFEYMEEQ